MLTNQECPGIDSARATFRKLLNDKPFREQVSYLYERWLDERAYEDWRSYEEFYTKLLDKSYPGTTLVASTKRPMSFQMKHESCATAIFTLKITSKGANAVFELTSRRIT